MSTTEKIIDKVRKLLALSKDGAATEAEAALAAARAAEIMEAHGLEMFAIERSGGEGEARGNHQQSSSFGAWYEALIKVVCESFFCHVVVEQTGKKHMRFQVVGRKSAVVSSVEMYEYLRKTVWRLGRESGVDNPRLFRHGCAERVIERIRERHRETLVRQQREAEAARAASPGGASGGLPAVTLVDHAQREADLNRDFLRGVKPGTTAAERDERLRQQSEKDELYAELQRQGIDKDVAWWMAYVGNTREEAEAREQAARDRRSKEENDPKAKKKADDYWDRQYRRDEKKRSHPSFQAGRVAGDAVGLEQQVGRGTSTQKIGSK